jgi:hypothetical protein
MIHLLKTPLAWACRSSGFLVELREDAPMRELGDQLSLT